MISNFRLFYSNQTIFLLQIPIYKGAAESLVHCDLPDVEPFHGADGMCDLDDVDGPDFPNNIDAMAQPENAVEMINKIVMSVSFDPRYLQTSQLILFCFSQRPKQVTIIGIGPLTNIALALKTYPELADNLKDIYVMGGNYNGSLKLRLFNANNNFLIDNFNLCLYN